MIVFSRPHDQIDADDLSSMPCSPSILSSMSFATPPVPNNTPLPDANSNNYKTIKAEIVKDVTGLGFIIEGGKQSSFGDRPITIKRIFRGN